MIADKNQTPNKLINESSPYLLQHAYNPVNWYAWGQEAFEKAKAEDKPIFLSIGYSTCHWCHVMEAESFENEALAKMLNEDYIAIKVDKEERPDIDGIYMRVCQAFTGSGGWPTSVFMSPDQMPFFAGTYYPPEYFASLLERIKYNWKENRKGLLKSSDEIIRSLDAARTQDVSLRNEDLANSAYVTFRRSFDSKYGGFGNAPKFPSPHNLLFLMEYALQHKKLEAFEMAEKTLLQMYKGGIFDHIGYGFSRYSTDKFWLLPHFEKMLYDNAMLASAYLAAYEATGKEMYKTVAEKIFIYIEREMRSEAGGFYSAQDADSDGVEGKYYALTPGEVTEVLGASDGAWFNETFDITQGGNFEGKNVPNLLKQESLPEVSKVLIDKLYEYRKNRVTLRKDHKILTSWNALMLWAYAEAYRILGEEKYLDAAIKSVNFIETNLARGDELYAGITDGHVIGKGFLDDYAFYTLALLSLYQATFDVNYLQRALSLCEKTVDNFFDQKNGGFYFYGEDSEHLILRPKETYDGAIPSGNSVMVYNLDRIAKLTKDEKVYGILKKQVDFVKGQAYDYPAGHSFYLYSTLPTEDIVCVPGEDYKSHNLKAGAGKVMRVLSGPTKEYPLKNEKTTFYVCRGNTCLPPTNVLKGNYDG